MMRSSSAVFSCVAIAGATGYGGYQSYSPAASSSSYGSSQSYAPASSTGSYSTPYYAPAQTYAAGSSASAYQAGYSETSSSPAVYYERAFEEENVGHGKGHGKHGKHGGLPQLHLPEMHGGPLGHGKHGKIGKHGKHGKHGKRSYRKEILIEHVVHPEPLVTQNEEVYRTNHVTKRVHHHPVLHKTVRTHLQQENVIQSKILHHMSAEEDRTKYLPGKNYNGGVQHVDHTTHIQPYQQQTEYTSSATVSPMQNPPSYQQQPMEYASAGSATAAPMQYPTSYQQTQPVQFSSQGGSYVQQQ